MKVALSQAAFDRLVADHGPALYRMAYRMVGDRHEAEDIVQETYRSAWSSRHGYQSGHSQRLAGLDFTSSSRRSLAPAYLAGARRR